MDHLQIGLFAYGDAAGAILYAKKRRPLNVAMRIVSSGLNPIVTARLMLSWLATPGMRPSPRLLGSQPSTRRPRLERMRESVGVPPFAERRSRSRVGQMALDRCPRSLSIGRHVGKFGDGIDTEPDVLRCAKPF